MPYGAMRAAALLAVGTALALAVWPAGSASASASVSRSSICKTYAAAKAQEDRASAALEKRISTETWPTIQKTLLSIFAGESHAEKQLDAYARTASTKVRNAAAVALKLDRSFTTIAKTATSFSAFETAVTAAQSTGKVKAASTVLNAYSTKLCGSTTTTS